MHVQAKKDSQLTHRQFVEKYRGEVERLGSRKMTGVMKDMTDIEEVCMYVCIYVSMHYVWCMYICMYVYEDDGSYERYDGY
jgi:hypothetical protein